MKPTKRTSAAIRNEIENLAPELRLTYGRHAAAVARRKILHALAESELSYIKGGERMTVGEHQTRIAAVCGSPIFVELAVVDAIIFALEASQFFAPAAEALPALEAELAAAAAAEEELQHARAEAAAKVAEVEALARAKAEAALAEDAGVAEARRALAAVG